MEKIKAVIYTRDITFGIVTSSSSDTSSDSTICRSINPTSSEVKCSLFSKLTSVKSIKSVTLTPPTSLGAYTTEVALKIDVDYQVGEGFLPLNPGNKIMHLEGMASFLLDGNLIAESNLDASSIPNGNSISAIVPAGSCFNLTLQESITTITMPFSASASLRSLETNSVIGLVLLQGEIKANILSSDYNEGSPCSDV